MPGDDDRSSVNSGASGVTTSGNMNTGPEGEGLSKELFKKREAVEKSVFGLVYILSKGNIRTMRYTMFYMIVDFLRKNTSPVLC